VVNGLLDHPQRLAHAPADLTVYARLILSYNPHATLHVIRRFSDGGSCSADLGAEVLEERVVRALPRRALALHAALDAVCVIVEEPQDARRPDLVRGPGALLANRLVHGGAERGQFLEHEGALLRIRVLLWWPNGYVRLYDYVRSIDRLGRAGV
jgi:hypothetical protein